MISLGYYQMRGLAEPQQVFGVPDEIPHPPAA
jgi:hypothetical protein